MGKEKYKLQLLVAMELPQMWRDFNLAESGGNTHTVGKTGHHSIFRPVQSKMILPSNHQVKVLHMKKSFIRNIIGSELVSKLVAAFRKNTYGYKPC